jgi:hypothetical protein
MVEIVSAPTDIWLGTGTSMQVRTTTDSVWFTAVGSSVFGCGRGTGAAQTVTFTLTDAATGTSNIILLGQGRGAHSAVTIWPAYVPPPTPPYLLGNAVIAGESTCSGSYTCHAENDRELIVFVSVKGMSGAAPITSVTYGGNALTYVTGSESYFSTAGGFYYKMRAYRLLEADFPSTGAQTLTVNMAITADRIIAHIIELGTTGQAALEDIVHSEGTGTSPYVDGLTVSTEEGAIVVCGATDANATAWSPSNCTEGNESNTGDVLSACSGYAVDQTTGDKAPGFTANASGGWGCIGLVIPPAT